MTRRSFIGFLLAFPILNKFKSKTAGISLLESEEVDVLSGTSTDFKMPKGNQWREMNSKKTTSVEMKEANPNHLTFYE